MTSAPPPPPTRTPAARVWVLVQLAIAWLPVLALYSLIIITVHGGKMWDAVAAGARAIAAAALLGMLVLRITRKLPWPRPMTTRFVALQVATAVGFSLSWVTLTLLIESAVRWEPYLLVPSALGPFLLLGLWLYVAVAGVSYAVSATARAAQAETLAAESRLESLRGQLNPHFLFNALHTVVQLIPLDPERAGEAAEQIAALLRQSIREDRDVVPLRDEIAFVMRYLELERLRFGDRLSVQLLVDGTANAVLVPSFVVQTLVENAVRHGVEPRIDDTSIRITAERRRAGGSLGAREVLVVIVADTGTGMDTTHLGAHAGTGLRRLRERLTALYGDAGTLTLESTRGEGCVATVTIPVATADDA